MAVASSRIRVVEPDEAFIYGGVYEMGRLGGLCIPESEATSYRCIRDRAIVQKSKACMLVDGFDLFICSHQLERAVGTQRDGGCAICANGRRWKVFRLQ